MKISSGIASKNTAGSPHILSRGESASALVKRDHQAKDGGSKVARKNDRRTRGS